MRSAWLRVTRLSTCPGASCARIWVRDEAYEEEDEIKDRENTLCVESFGSYHRRIDKDPC